MGEAQADMVGESPALVPAVDRAIQILKAFQSDDQLLGVSDISRRLELHKSTVHDILHTLAHHQFLVRDEATRKYRLGPALSQMNGRGQRPTLAEVAPAFVHELAARVEETAILATPADDHLCIAAVGEPAREMHIAARVGQRLPLMAGAPAKVLLAALPEREARARLASHPLRPFTPHTIVDPARYLALLPAVRAAGYACDDEEYLAGVRAIAAPVRNRDGVVVAALFVVGFTSRLTDDRIEALRTEVLATAGGISAALGWHSLEEEAI